ncbi:hypothetical protein [Photobacterium minamisatsumaniensis]|uniref:hypothetical protein n=1 Tax=Photobacterium minamisatsumaniensis TaxID=2910233 RepID=UPI003D11044C
MNKDTPTLWQRFKSAAIEVMDFKSRVWVINIHSSVLQDESFVINEDSFQEPLQWMKRRQYTSDMQAKVEQMKTSQVLVFHIDGVRHRLMRVK